jgi:hypothetical protein
MNLKAIIRDWLIEYEPTPAELGYPKRGPDAVKQARFSAIAVESDREQLRTDLMRRLRENTDEGVRINAALDELDALRILECAS